MTPSAARTPSFVLVSSLQQVCRAFSRVSLRRSRSASAFSPVASLTAANNCSESRTTFFKSATKISVLNRVFITHPFTSDGSFHPRRRRRSPLFGEYLPHTLRRRLV